MSLNNTRMSRNSNASLTQSNSLEERTPITKQLEKNSQLYLSSNKGVAMVCEPGFGDLPANASVEVKVTLYNDICGEFHDYLLVNIESLPLHKIPVQVKVTGSPIALAPNQVGINMRGEFPLINMGTVIKGKGNICKSFNLVNNGPSEAVICTFLNSDQDVQYGP